MLYWVDQFNDTSSVLHEILLGMDNHGAQQTQAIRDKLRQSNKLPAYTPQIVPTLSHHQIIMLVPA